MFFVASCYKHLGPRGVHTGVSVTASCKNLFGALILVGRAFLGGLEIGKWTFLGGGKSRSSHLAFLGVYVEKNGLFGVTFWTFGLTLYFGPVLA